MSTVTKKDLIDRIANETGVKRADVRDVVQQFLEQVIDELGNGNRLEFRDFGVFEVKHRAARLAQNPRTLERVEVPPKPTVKFKIGRLMRESIEQTVRGDEQETHNNDQHHTLGNGTVPASEQHIEPKPHAEAKSGL